FTSGNDVYFADGFYRPGTAAGDFLLAHELVHVIQQGGAPQPIRRIGDWAHENIQKALRGIITNLITEAPIPGDTGSTARIGSMEPAPARMGFADLFTSSNDSISGVRGETGKPDDPLTRGDPPLKYRNIRKDDLFLHKPRIGPS